jgi:hypothetical protein
LESGGSLREVDLIGESEPHGVHDAKQT